MIVFKVDIKKELEKHGYNQQRIRKDKIMGQRSYYEMIRENKVPGLKGLSNLCMILNRQPGSLIKYIPDDNTNKQ